MSKVCKYSSTIDTIAREALQSKADLVDGVIPSSQLPSYVDDVLEYTSMSEFPETGESGKIYVDTSTNITYRWSGTTYISIGSDLALGETASTAYAGNKGKALADKIGSADISSIAGTITEAINTLNSKDGVVVTGTLNAGSTSLTLSNSKITTSSLIDIYSSVYGLSPLSVTVNTGSIAMTFAAQSSNITIKVVIK